MRRQPLIRQGKAPVIGFTTTIPVELIFASGCIPCDLNNIFITDDDPMQYLEKAERDGFPKSMCNWIKGIYGVVMKKKIDAVITVMEGDCSNTQALAEILQYKGVRTIPFSFPFDRDREVLCREIEKLKLALTVKDEELNIVENEMKSARSALEIIDRMTWDERLVSGSENHLWLVRASDMLGDYNTYRSMALGFIKKAKTRQPIDGVRIGYVGVPPIVPDIHDFIQSVGGHVVYNEIQRQFILPFKTINLVDRYLRYTYPYGVFARLEDMQREIEKRRIQGIIHYVQSFCYRAVEDVILREKLGVPMITIEGEIPKSLDSRTKLRIEAFTELLRNSGEAA
jgi:benzoyl-CoA reductase/2-hydroxyglutaryl-CoA dehydratase subunit BcrC/BadD/HgdB